MLAVDDDERTLRLLLRMLEAEGYRVAGAPDAASALRLVDEESPDLVLMDVVLPDMDGFALCERVRQDSEVPIIMVTAMGDDTQKVKGLDAGADDFVTKPFSHLELTARVRAVLRRTRAWEDRPEPAFKCHDLCIDFAQHRVTLGGRAVRLTATEYKVLAYLAQNSRRVLTTDQLLEKVWGNTYRGDPHLLQVSIGRLRRRLNDDARHPRFINTVHGIGYTLGEDSAADTLSP